MVLSSGLFPQKSNSYSCEMEELDASMSGEGEGRGAEDRICCEATH